MSKDVTFPFGQKPVWFPDEETVAKTNLRRFMDLYGIENIDALQQRSVSETGWFWDAVIKDLDIQFYTAYHEVFVPGSNPAFPRWCVGAEMNIVHNLLDKWQTSERADQIAVRYESEEGFSSALTYRELNAEVCRCANALRSIDIGRGDAVGIYMPMTPEIVVAFLAIIKVGGIILPLFSGYGPSAVATRLNDAGAKALFTADGFFRRGKLVPLKEIADEALADVPSVEHVIVDSRAGREDTPWVDGRDVRWNDFLRNQTTRAKTEVTNAEDTVMIIYTSGTTGRPKGAVHTHCGFPLKAAQDMYHSMDLHPGEVMYWMSDMGWMMGPWMVFGTLIIGATMVLYDGAADYPDAGRLWEMVERHKVTHLGLSPVLIRALKPHTNDVTEKHDLTSLRAIGSTGSPWDPESWMWLFENVLESKKPILNYSGGTEISGGIICGNFFKPLAPCSFSGPVPGMDADVVDPEGASIRGTVGELVIRNAWIGMTRGFWNDADRYIESYWNRFPGVWVHGDFAAIDENDLWYILGRSDDTIKVAGKRLGPAEVEALVNADPAIGESAAIGVPDKTKGQALVVFCVLAAEVEDLEVLRTRISTLIADELGRPLKPKAVRFVTALPKTRNAKVMRRVIRSCYLGEDPGNVTALEDESTLKAIANSL